MGNVSTLCYMLVDSPSGNKRCGGIGDCLAGVLGTYLAWQRLLDVAFREAEKSGTSGADSKSASASGRGGGPAVSVVEACELACHVVKRASQWGYDRKGRAMVAGDVLEGIPEVAEEILPSPV